MAGSIQDRGNGSYFLTVSNGFDANGKRIRKTRTVKAKGITEAREKLAEFVTEVKQGEYVAPSHIKLKQYATNQYMKHIRKKLSPSTIELYDGILNNYVYGRLGHLKLEKIRHEHINDYMEELEDKGLSSSSRQKHYNMLNGLFKLAVKNEVIKRNPMDRADNISVTYKNGGVYNEEEIKEFINMLDNEENRQMALLLKLAITSGMRRGELLALQWDDVNFNDNTIRIRQTLSYTKTNGYYLKKPKTERSNRVISIEPLVMDELRKHKLIKSTERMKTAELWEGGKHFFVFSSNFGKPLFPSVPSRYFSRLLKRTGFKKIRFHDLRHTHVSFLMSNGVPLNDISKRLGHASISTTYDIYGHLDRERDSAIASVFSTVL